MAEYKGSITAQISESTLEYTSQVEGMALSKWGFNKADIEKALAELQEYRDTGPTPEEVKDLKTDRDYWKAEALKHCAKLGEINLLMGRKEKG